MASKQVNLRLDVGLLERVDRARGDLPRERWLRRAVERALSETKEPASSEQASPGSVPSSEGVRLAAPAEQPPIHPRQVLRPARSFVRRDVEPVPKGKGG